jgi:hypothetical protein
LLVLPVAMFITQRGPMAREERYLESGDSETGP